MTSNEDQAAARRLARLALAEARPPSRRSRLATIQDLGRKRFGRRRNIPADHASGCWRDTMSTERPGWRERAATLAGEVVFAVDYHTCHRCNLGWVEQPYTEPILQRCGLARAGLAALRAEHPGLSWHTLGGHFSQSQPFWTAVGTDVTGHYHQRPVCPHVTA